MGLLVVAEPREAFDRWRLSNIAAAQTPPATEGEQLFMTRGCAMCHTIRGTNAGGRMGPDLSHVGGRKSLAAETLDNTYENLVGWIADPQGVKPGSKMPRADISNEEIEKVARWLESLK
jgi:cytochrome c oxidase subunit 2